MRPTLDRTFMDVALTFAKRSTCCRRAVGAVIVDEKNYVLSTGYNGQPSGFVHCSEQQCMGAGLPSGQGLDSCEAIHAEQNAIARLKEPFAARTIYCTTAPCISCTKLLLATGIRHVVFESDYPTSGKELWQKAGREWYQIVK